VPDPDVLLERARLCRQAGDRLPVPARPGDILLRPQPAQQPVLLGVPDRSAQEKVDILRAYGAEVVIAPSMLPKQHPDHLFNVVARLVEEIPGAWLANQYDNPANPDAHRRTTGPEIWRQTAGRITHFVAGVGTGGTITGAGAYLREVSGGAVTVVGADPEASVYSGGDGSPYYVESIGHFLHPDTVEDAWPASYHPGAVNRFERIPDRESLLTARALAREEGLLAGPSSGTAVAAALRVARELGPGGLVVVLLPDSGRSYLSKTFSDEWLRAWGFLEDEPGRADGELTVRDVLDRDPGWAGRLVTVSSRATVGQAAARLAAVPPALAAPPALAVPVALVVLDRERRHGITAAEVVGSVDLAILRAAIDAGRISAGSPVTDHMAGPLPTVGIGQPVSRARAALRPGPPAAVVLRDGRAVSLIGRAELDRVRHLAGSVPGQDAAADGGGRA
jgi:cystathionine beta-synthase